MKGLKRRELLGCAAVLLGGGCATMPARSARLPGGSTQRAADRACDHELCRYWRPPEQPVAQAPGEFRLGRCSVGLPEDL